MGDAGTSGLEKPYWTEHTTDMYAREPERINGLAVINLTKNPLTEGDNYIWLTAVVKSDATLGDIIDADIIQVDYICEGENGIRSFETKEPGGLKIFARQSIVYAPTSDSCRFYRIPAMILDRNRRRTDLVGSAHYCSGRWHHHV